MKWFGFKKSLLFSGHKCPYYAKDGLGILESPNFPGEYPTGVECHWRVRPNRNKRVLILISSISLDSNCGDLLTIRKTGKFWKSKIGCHYRAKNLKITKESQIRLFLATKERKKRNQSKANNWAVWHFKQHGYFAPQQ